MGKKLLFIIASFLIPAFFAHAEVSPTYVARSQGLDGARKLAGVSDKVHLYEDERYVNLTAAAEYTRSFREDRIGQCLFGSD